MAENSVSLRALKHLSLSENDMLVVWKSLIQQFEWYAIETNLENKTLAVQLATFMIAIGPDAANIFNMFSLSEAKSKNLNVIKTKFNAYFAPKTNIMYERYLFNKITQAEGQPFNDFLTSLVNQGKNCPKCGYNYQQRMCPAVRKECKKCGKVGHFAQVCRSRQVLRVIPSNTKVLMTFSKDSVPVLGEADVKVFTNKITPHLGTFLTVDKGHQCILGRERSVKIWVS
ncbi:hypothetical protein PR048_011548 [Dryococelus australis]|uniref:CCHC-type domain-containing protein n=1 Tax=Dryococelus australis TaxID=614101 RepID=A0ABQ9HMM6_9NEOP|nr:hypothetical protein PR048_011548 [Dryococelus australis]